MNAGSCVNLQCHAGAKSRLAKRNVVNFSNPLLTSLHNRLRFPVGNGIPEANLPGSIACYVSALGMHFSRRSAILSHFSHTPSLVPTHKVWLIS